MTCSCQHNAHVPWHRGITNRNEYWVLNHFAHVTVFQNSIRNCRWIWVHLREAYLVWCLKCQSLFEFKRKKGWVDTFIENCYCQIPSFRERVFHFNVNNKYGNQTLTKCYFIQCHFAHLLNHFTWIQLFFHCEMFQITKPDHYSLIAPEWSLLPVNNRRMWELEMRWFWISYESERERERAKKITKHSITWNITWRHHTANASEYFRLLLTDATQNLNTLFIYWCVTDCFLTKTINFNLSSTRVHISRSTIDQVKLKSKICGAVGSRDCEI